MANSITLGLEYEGTDFTRNLKIADVDASIVSAAATVKAKIKAINQSLEGGNSGGMDTFYRADDYDDSDPSAVIGTLKKIATAKIVSETVTNINLDIDTEGDASNG